MPKQNKTKALLELEKERAKYPDIVYDICDAVQDEYVEHDTCGYDIGCILHSETLYKRIKSLLNKQKVRDRESCNETVFVATYPEFRDVGVAKCQKCGHKIKISRLLLEEMLSALKSYKLKKK